MEEAKKIWDKVQQWEPELERLKQILAKTELVETVKWGAPVYVWNKRNVVGLGGFKHYFTLWFFNGVFLSDPKKVLVNANEENTKSLRQWRFATMADIDEKAILQYLNEAIQVEKDGKSIAPTPRSNHFEIPEVLTDALKTHGLQTAFEKFTPFRQREFAEYISEAKQEKTKVTRIEKILPMIADGRGLNDKYRK